MVRLDSRTITVLLVAVAVAVLALATVATRYDTSEERSLIVEAFSVLAAKVMSYALELPANAVIFEEAEVDEETAVAAGTEAEATAAAAADDTPSRCVEALFAGDSDGRNLFFIKVSAADRTTLDGDELCGLESAMRAFGRDHCYFLLTTSTFEAPPTLAAVERELGTRLNRLKWADYLARWRAAGTLPHMQTWYKGGAWRTGFPLNNLSNGLRLVMLYNHGGAYFDLDILHRQPPPVEGSFLAWQSVKVRMLNNAALQFTRQHPFLDLVTTKFAQFFNGTRWGHNGPSRVTATYLTACTRNRKHDWCSTITELPPEVYFPVAYGHRWKLYAQGANKTITDATHGIHLWKASRMNDTGGLLDFVQPNSIVHRVAQQACPYTLRAIGLEGLSPSAQAQERAQAAPAEILADWDAAAGRAS